MKEFQRSFQPIQFQVQQEQQAGREETVDWGSAEWGTHRHLVRQLMEHSMELLSVKDKAVVLGAGTHGDVDLPDLANRFVEVTVLDTEANAIEEVLGPGSSAPISGKLNSLTNVDYTCLDQIQFYETWEEMLLNEAPAEEVAAYIKDCAFRVRHRDALPQWKRSFSLAVSSSVHTQLFYIHALSQFAGYADQYGPDGVPQIIGALQFLRNSLVTGYNRMLTSLLKPDGRLVVWTDMIRLEEHNRALLEQLYGMRSEEERTRFLFRAFGQYGTEAAVLGMKDLQEKLNPFGQLFKCWVWSTETDKQYIAAGFSSGIRA
ncbi:hypothetical protein N0M98_04325 [Paenibacillus doosanensis]|uniref:Class I SAM-dependent methyltransferase n=1 Tax=Paenibacillus konkukensis TaxID=2020716 RepID=A0ABY4S163_9BACL|nr:MULTISPECIES: hypothetical protein [Paenibacillus]MCS7459356.1 hypothetical protein [Paenibacillus doosanensis]UQZ87149.1 hypothetical protein SK3146_06446 [Paenibacillus konkukensis]